MSENPYENRQLTQPAGWATPQQPMMPAYSAYPSVAPGGLMTDQRNDTAHTAIAWVVAVVTLGYMLPWAIAATRGKSNAGAIGLVNFFTGWFFGVGWVVALVMACSAHNVAYAGGPGVNVTMAQQHFPAAQTANTIVGDVPLPAAGWYPAPDGAGRQYWDGRAWTEHRAV